MKRTLSHIAFFFCLFCFTSKIYAQLPAAPATATSNVAEASQYGVLYELNLPVSVNYNSLASVLYSVNNSGLSLNYNRVAYFVQLDSKWVWVSMNKFNTTNAQLGVPYANSGIIYQQVVTGMNVASSAGSGVTNATNINGNIEIWPDCYDVPAALGGIGGNAGNYDFNDTRQANSNCYGSFQVHNYGASQTIFAINDFMGGTLDLGIGNNVGNGNPDWTFMANAASYTTTRKLYVLVQKGTTIVTQPSTLVKNACLNGTTTALTLSTSVNTGTITNYQWYSVATATNTGGTLVATHTSTLTNDSYTPATSAVGTLYYYCVVNSSGSNVTTSSASGAQTIVNPTISVSGAAAICAGASISLSSTSSSTFTSYAWSNSATTSGINVSPSSTTNYSVTATTSIGCVAASLPVTVTVNALPTISASSGTICNGSSFVFSPSGASTYTYSGGSSNVSPSTTTNYTISGTNAAGCIGTNTGLSVLVNPLPIISITGTNAICVGLSANLTANGAATYTWNTGSNASGISVSPASTTNYSVTGTSAEGCISAASAATTITVYALPIISIAGESTVCAGSSLALTASGANTYTWSTAENTAIINASPSSLSTYSVDGTSVNGCLSNASAVTSVSVITLPILSISGNNAICAGATTSLSASGAASYTWNSGTNSANITVAPAGTTNYSVSGSTSEGCMSASAAVVTVTVNTVPVISISGTNAICAGTSASLTANGASSYTWNTTSNATGILVSPTITTSYSVSGTSSEGCLSASNGVANITVFDLPLISISSANTVCAGSSLAVSASGANSYSWSTGANAVSINVTPLSNTNYSVSGTDANGCVSSSSAVTTVSVSNLPILTISGNSVLCVGATANLNAGGATTYTWNTGSNASNLSVSPLTTTTYTLSGSNAEGCISASDAVMTVTVNALPIVSITGTTEICAGTSASLTANGASTYTWNTTSNASGILVSPTTNTNYSLTGTSAAGCISASQAVTTLTVYALPTISVAGNNTVCAGASLALTASGATSYSWNTGASSALINVSPTTTTNYSVSGTDANGCVSSSSAVATVSTISLPVLSITGPTAICAGNTASLSASGATSFTWDSGSNNSSLSVSPSNATSYSVSGSNVFGCLSASAAVISVAVNALPLVAITGSNALCSGASTSLTANGASSYTWNTNSTASGISVSPTVTTNYSVSGTSSAGCLSASPAITTITVYALPTLSITPTNTVCAGSALALTASGAASYSWTTGATSAVINVTPSAQTNFSVSGSSVNGCVSASSAVTTVSVFSLPTLSINGTSTVCAGGSVSLTANGAATFTWNTGSNNSIISVSPASTTVYSVVGTSSLGCVSTTAALQTLTVHALPVLSITGGPQVICAGLSTSLVANGATTYTWVGISSAASLTVSPTTSTTYTLAGTSSLSCLGIPALRTITVNPLPLVSTTGTTSVCDGKTATITAVGAATYTWTGIGSSTAIAVSPSVTTTYTLVGTSTLGCNQTALHTLTVNALPTLTILGSTGICTGQSASLNVSGASTYSWSTGSTSNSIVTLPSSNTVYTVTGTNALGCVKTNTQLVTVAATLSVTISAPIAICEGDALNLTASGGATYTWNTNQSTQVISPSPSVTTTYSVIGASGTCSNTAFATVVVYPNPTLSISGSNAICLGDSTLLTVTGADTYVWSNAVNSNSVVLTPSATTVYSVVGQYTTGCFSGAAQTITVYALPLITVSGDSVLCLGKSLVLSANGAATYTWNTGANSNSISVSPANTSTYSVLANDANGCKNNSAIVTVTVNPVPAISIVSTATSVCAGDSVSLTVSGADQYVWDDNSTSPQVVYTPSTSTNYSVVGTNSFLCSSSTQLVISVKALPILALTAPSVVCLNESVSLSATGAASYTWSTGDNGATTVVTPTGTSTYSITGTSAEGCSSTATLQVEVSACTGINAVAASNKVSLYPNPTSSAITLEMTDAQDAVITVRNVLGQLLLLQKAETKTTVQLQDLNKGMYYLSITKNNEVIYTSTVIKN